MNFTSVIASRSSRVTALSVALIAACGGDGPTRPGGGGEPTVASITVTPSDVRLTYLGERQELTAETRADDGSLISGADLTWTSLAPEIVEVASTGRLEAVSVGTTEIRVSVGTVKTTVPVEVTQVATEVRLSPGAARLIGAGDTLTFVAEARDRGGHTIPSATFTWSSEEPGVANVDEAGRATAVGHGTAALKAVVGDGVSGTADVQVVAATGEGVASVDRALVDLMQRWHVPGLSIAVVEDGRLVVARGLGLAHPAADEPMRPDHRVRIASVSKSITATAILKLVERGDVALDDRVFPDLLPDLWADAQPPGDARLADITVRELLHHQGGWDQFSSGDPMFMSRDVASALGVPSPPEATDIVRYVLARPLDFAPGTSVSYSNFGFSLLARVIESVTGMPYETWVRDEILGPADATGFRIGGSLLADRQAMEVYYSGLGRDASQVASVFDALPGQVPLPYGGFYLSPMDGNGGWVGSVVDLVRFAGAVDGRAEDDVISAASRDLVAEDPVPLSGGRYGLGWFVDSDGTWHHTGRLPGSASRLVIRADGLTYAALLNASDPDEAAFLGDLVSTLATATAAVTAWPDRDLFTEFD
ncbi:MAG: serine hydrolase [Gemmatimonadales bacterium]|jgi:N-acyl-D-amino-acid deacylase